MKLNNIKIFQEEKEILNKGNLRRNTMIKPLKLNLEKVFLKVLKHLIKVREEL